MNRKQLRRRLFSSLFAVGLVAAAALVPTPALAVGGPNLSAGKQASASGANGPYGAANVNDGNAQTYWESPSNSFPQWVQIDLGAGVAIDQVILKLPPATAWATRTQTLSLQGSTDGSSFSVLSGSAGRIFDPASANTVTITFAAATVRYVRVTSPATPAGRPRSWPSWRSTAWPAARTRVTHRPARTWPRGKPIEASSSTFTFVPGNANDGSPTTYWEAAGYPATLTVQLGANPDVTGVVVKLNPDPAWGTRTQNIQVLGRDQAASTFTSLVAARQLPVRPGQQRR